MNTTPVEMIERTEVMTSHRLIDHIDRVLIVAYKESTEQLEAAFRHEGFQCDVLRQRDEPEYQGYSSSYRCMLNHSRAWAYAAQAEKPTLIVEADFVPVMGLGRLPLPFSTDYRGVGICWLYTCAPQVYSVSPEGYAEGYSSGLVAYILTPQGAAALTGIVEETTRQRGTGYVTFDSDIDSFLRDRQFKNYIPFRNYGEHGGISNPEHRQNGLSGVHRADVLYGRLAFTPAYAAADSRRQVALIQARGMARLKGIARLVMGKFVRPQVLQRCSAPLRVLGFAVRRQLSIKL